MVTTLFLYQIFRSARYALLHTAFGYVSHCPHYPRCGSYGLQKIKENGVITGSLQALWRVLRCW